jgi:hypothetical protein
MYRSLFQHAFSTEYVYVLKLFWRAGRQQQPLSCSKLPQEKPTPNPRHRTANVRSSIHFAPGTQSSVSETTAVNGFTPTGDVQLESGPGTSIPELVHENIEEKAEIEMV